MFSSSMRATLVALVLSATAASAAPGLSLKVVAPESVSTVADLKLVVTVKNTGDETLRLLNDPTGVLVNTPTEAWDIASETGAVPEFTGMHVKWTAEALINARGGGDLTILAPGASIDIKHDLSTAYNFTGSGAATYDFVAGNKFQYLTDSGLAEIYAETEAATVAISGTLAVPRVEASIDKRATFVGCSATRQTQLNSAASAAQTYAANARSYLSSLTAGAPRYTTWFGAYTAARRTTVLNNFTKISGASFAGFTYDCSTCTMSAYAYVYANQYGRIYLCSAFWSAPATGTDSKAGTLVHEASHFTTLAGTADVVYGQSGARSLATSNPARAITNADSHEYFAENTPAQS